MLECVDIYDDFITLNIAGSDYIRWYLRCRFSLARKTDRWTNERIGLWTSRFFFSSTKTLTVPVSNNCSRTPVRSSSVIAGASKIASIQKIHYQSGLIWTSTKQISSSQLIIPILTLNIKPSFSANQLSNKFCQLLKTQMERVEWDLTILCLGL